MTKEELDQKLKEIDAKHVQVNEMKQQLLTKADELTAEELRLQGEYRVIKKMRDDLDLPVMDSAPVV